MSCITDLYDCRVMSRLEEVNSLFQEIMVDCLSQIIILHICEIYIVVFWSIDLMCDASLPTLQKIVECHILVIQWIHRLLGNAKVNIIVGEPMEEKEAN